MKHSIRLFLLLPLVLVLCALLPRTALAYTEADSAALKKMLHDEIWAGAEKIEFDSETYGSITETEIQHICSLLYKEPDLFILNPNSGFSTTREVEHYTLIPPYLPILLPNYEKAKEEYTAVLTDLLSGVESGWSPLEKILYCHDLICTRYKHNYITRATGQVPGDCTSAYTMMTTVTEEGEYKREGTDMAYAMLFKAMIDGLNLSGVQCTYASGKFSDDTVHNWNVIRLDEQWYNVDVYEDDYNLKSTLGLTDIPGHASHSYFLVSTDHLINHDRQAHYATEIQYVLDDVVCGSTVYESYVWQNALSPFVRMNSVWYFLDDKTQTIRYWDGRRERTDEVLDMQTVYEELKAPSTTYLVLTGMFGLGGRLYFTTARYLMRFDPLTGEWEVLHDTMDDTNNSNYQVRGCALKEDAEGNMSMAYLLWLNNAAQSKSEPIDPFRIVEGSTDSNGYGYYVEGGTMYLRIERGFPVMVASFDQNDQLLKVVTRSIANEQTLRMDGEVFRIFAMDSDYKPRCDVVEGKWNP